MALLLNTACEKWSNAICAETLRQVLIEDYRVCRMDALFSLLLEINTCQHSLFWISEMHIRYMERVAQLTRPPPIMLLSRVLSELQELVGLHVRKGRLDGLRHAAWKDERTKRLQADPDASIQIGDGAREQFEAEWIENHMQL